MPRRFHNFAQKVAQKTPEDRNRYADFLRTLSLLVVVFGHWLLAYITQLDGELKVERLLAVVPQTQWLTWFLQVMPVFFFVGGFANAVGWESAQKRGHGVATWLQLRSQRLLYPLLPLLLVWIPLVFLIGKSQLVSDYLLFEATRAVLIPTWFLAAYLCVVALSPLAYKLHRRFGAAALGGFITLIIAVDLLHRAGVPWIGWTNFLWVWGAIHQMGFFWYDQKITGRPALALILTIFGFALLFYLTHFQDYPLSMVGTGDPNATNNSPPSIALAVMGFSHIGLIMALEKPMQRLLQRPSIWALVVLAGSRVMTVFVWHMTALVALAGVLYLGGIWAIPEHVDATWWLSRIPWLLMLSVLLAILVALFGRFERPRQDPPPIPDTWPARLLTILSLATVVITLSILISQGLHSPDSPLGLPLIKLAILFAGLAGLNTIPLYRLRQPD